MQLLSLIKCINLFSSTTRSKPWIEPAGLFVWVFPHHVSSAMWVHEHQGLPSQLCLMDLSSFRSSIMRKKVTFKINQWKLDFPVALGMIPKALLAPPLVQSRLWPWMSVVECSSRVFSKFQENLNCNEKKIQSNEFQGVKKHPKSHVYPHRLKTVMIGPQFSLRLATFMFWHHF